MALSMEARCLVGDCAHNLVRGVRVSDLLRSDGPYRPVARPVPVMVAVRGRGNRGRD